MLGLVDLSRKLARGTLTSRRLVEDCFARIDAPEGQGANTYLTVYRDAALALADHVDKARANGWPVPRFAGIPLSIKDLFDVAGEVTRAGSRVLDNEPPATQDAVIVQRLRAAGFIVLGKVNMTEFAYSGLGINPHFGTPLAPFEREVGRIPGGSSSGGAVSVADEMAAGTIGTDTGGSCRIPAAFCGIVGFKPTSTRVSKDGVIPLSTSLDSVGPLASSVSCAAVLDAVLAGGAGEDVESFPEGGLRIGVLDNYVTDEVDDAVGAAFSAALTRLSQRATRVAPVTLGCLEELPDIYRQGGLAAAESFAWHRRFLATRKDLYDPWIRTRIESGELQMASDYIEVLHRRQAIQADVANRTDRYDVLVCPTVAIIPPELAPLADPNLSGRTNLMTLRNTAVGNFLDRPSITLPCHEPGTAPVGFMLMGRHGEDRRLLSIARGLEQIVGMGA